LIFISVFRLWCQCRISRPQKKGESVKMKEQENKKTTPRSFPAWKTSIPVFKKKQ
jgi:hypothetical protein